MLWVQGWWRQSGLAWAQEAACRVAESAYRGGRHETAYRLFNLLAGQGHPTSHFYLGCIHEQGQGVPVDAVQAGLCYRQAALLGHDEAQFRLAALYATGQGFMQDSLQAFYWYRRAAGQGHAGASRLLRQWSFPVLASCRI